MRPDTGGSGAGGPAGPGLAELSNDCYNAVGFVSARLDAGLGDGGSALIIPDDGGPILLRVETMTEGIGARVRAVR